jgi:peptidoglycan/xylan/chitin deacetylase (PgdA/CDA1 family)
MEPTEISIACQDRTPSGCMSTLPTMPPEQVVRKQRIKNFAYALLGSTSFFSGLTWAKTSLSAGPSLRILIYYKVNAVPGNTLSVPPRAFVRQLHFLKDHFTVITPEDLVRIMTAGQSLPDHAVLLTFDDGYQDVYDRAYPVMKELGLRALLFPATDYIASGKPYLHDERLSMANPVLNWEQLRAMQDVFAVGSHTKSHRRLTQVSLAEAKDEIYSSKALLEDQLSRPVQFFCYPKGTAEDFNEPLEDLVREAGYLGSFVALTGPNTLDRVRSCKWLRRFQAEPFEDFMFARLLDGSCDAIGFKDSGWGCSAKRAFNRLLRTSTG